MERDDERLDNEVIDLGSVITETKGGVQGFDDTPSGLRIKMGLTND